MKQPGKKEIREVYNKLENLFPKLKGKIKTDDYKLLMIAAITLRCFEEFGLRKVN
ncbi:hypothetical protein L0244_22055 [bacterium]|nr:hypothetical protein [bacterium]